MITKKELLDELTLKYNGLKYDAKTDLIHYKDLTIPFKKIYQNYLKENGMSFKCICDLHWECKSILECTKCGTVIKYSYDDWDYEPNFRCPVCTTYKTGFEYHTKEEIESSEELQAIIRMYKDLKKSIEERNNRRERRAGLEDYQLCKPKRIKLGQTIYKFDLLVNSIVSGNKLEGLRMEVSKWHIDNNMMSKVWDKKIPLSIEAFLFYKYVLPEIENNPEKSFLEQLKGKPLSQSMEEATVKRLKKG